MHACKMSEKYFDYICSIHHMDTQHAEDYCLKKKKNTQMLTYYIFIEPLWNKIYKMNHFVISISQFLFHNKY